LLALLNARLLTDSTGVANNLIEESSDNIKSSICKNFMYNKCNRGDTCKYIHDSTICFHFWKYENCKFGEDCRKSHTFNNTQIQTEQPQTFRRQLKKRNTECFEPMSKPVDMRIVYDNGNAFECSSIQLTSRDLLLAPNAFNDFDPGELYQKLSEELNNCTIPQEKLLKMWHGNDKIEGTHLIADDKTRWKEQCPTFKLVIERIRDFFNMDIQATRFNLYKDTSQWKPFHFDAAAVNPEKAEVQNFTVGVSFGATRDAAFEHAKTKIVISLPQADGCIYAFAKDTNIIWRHGILQDIPVRDEGRISIIAWRWVNHMEKLE
jgi:hypothetical protein